MTNGQLNVQFLREALYHELEFLFPDFDKLSGEHDYFSTKGILCSGILLIAGIAEICVSTLLSGYKLNIDWNKA